jgi:D-sedoheptulose 7-phosphate isomerase
MGYCYGMTEVPIEKLNSYFSRVHSLLKDIDRSQIIALAREFKAAKTRDGIIYVCGNGGSATLSSHFATDLGSGSVLRGAHYPIISLTDSSPIITASANDFGYENIFSRQLSTFAKSKDLLFMISSSGNSMNLIEACRYAKLNSVRTCALLGFDGGILSSLVDTALVVKSVSGDYGPVEDVHSCVLHALTELLRNEIDLA